MGVGSSIATATVMMLRRRHHPETCELKGKLSRREGRKGASGEGRGQEAANARTGSWPVGHRVGGRS